MKKNLFTYVSILAIIAVASLQGLGLMHSYRFMEERLFVRVNRCFMEAMRKEGSLRCIEAFKVIGQYKYATAMYSVQHSVMSQIRPDRKGENNIKEFILMLSAQGMAHYMDSAGMYKSQIQPDILDSLFRDELYNIGYSNPKYRIDSGVPITTAQYTYLNDLAHDSTLIRNGKEMATSICPYKPHCASGYQAVLYNPQGKIFKELQFFILATLLLSFTILFCIWKQFQIVKRQNKLSRLHENFSHFIINNEMKTPMDTIVSKANMLQHNSMDSTDTPEKEKELLALIGQPVETLLTLTNRILTLYKLDNGKLELHKQEIALGPIIRNIKEKYTTKDSTSIRFITELKTETVFADEELLKESLNILIENILRNISTPVEISLSITASGNETVRILIKDNCMKTRKKSLPGDEDSNQLGINYLRHVIKVHSGTIIFNQVKDKYNEIILTLPQSP